MLSYPEAQRYLDDQRRIRHQQDRYAAEDSATAVVNRRDPVAPLFSASVVAGTRAAEADRLMFLTQSLAATLGPAPVCQLPDAGIAPAQAALGGALAFEQNHNSDVDIAANRGWIDGLSSESGQAGDATDAEETDEPDEYRDFDLSIFDEFQDILDEKAEDDGYGRSEDEDLGPSVYAIGDKEKKYFTRRREPDPEAMYRAVAKELGMTPEELKAKVKELGMKALDIWRAQQPQMFADGPEYAKRRKADRKQQDYDRMMKGAALLGYHSTNAIPGGGCKASGRTARRFGPPRPPSETHAKYRTLERFSKSSSTREAVHGTPTCNVHAGGSMCAYSMDLRERVLRESDAGMKAAAGAVKYHVSASWVRRLKQRRRETGEVAPRQQRYGRHPVLAPQLHTLAALIQEQPDRTLANCRWRLPRRPVWPRSGGPCNSWASPLKKTVRAAEHDRPDIAAARAQWAATAPTLDPTRLVFLDESGGATSKARISRRQTARDERRWPWPPTRRRICSVYWGRRSRNRLWIEMLRYRRGHSEWPRGRAVMFTRGSTIGFLVVLTAGWFLAATDPIGAAGRAQPAVSPPALPSPVQPVVAKYCVTCHNEQLQTANLALDTLDPANVAADAEVWEKVIYKLRGGVMPPVGRPRPDPATYRAVVSWLEAEIDKAAVASPNPGRVATFRRLNRFEYGRAIKDLLDLEADVSALLPMDSTSDEGFDNNVSQLSVSPMLLDRYLAAARKISELAVRGAAPAPLIETFAVHKHLVQDERLSDDLPLAHRVASPSTITSRSTANIASKSNYRLTTTTTPVGGDAPGETAPMGWASGIIMSPEWEAYMLNVDKGLDVTFAAKAGPQVIGVSFVNEWTAPQSVPQPRPAGYGLATNEFPYGHASVDRLVFTGPLNPSGPGDTPSRARVLVCRPGRSQEERPCARTILSTLARRAYRRPITDADVEPLLAAYEDGRTRGDFDLGIQFALHQLLVDPNFLFRIEHEPLKAVTKWMSPVSDLELASRLSFFLWSSIPDDELRDLGTRGTLSQPTVLEQQVRRMLADPRATISLVDNFAAQWLQLRGLADVFRDPDLFPEFDENLRDSFERETKLFIESTLHENRSVVDLLRADYTYLNERLARHYGIPNVYGERFRRVELGRNDPRGGLLSHGSILTVTAYANRTSPVLRVSG